MDHLVREHKQILEKMEIGQTMKIIRVADIGQIFRSLMANSGKERNYYINLIIGIPIWTMTIILEDTGIYICKAGLVVAGDGMEVLVA